MLRAMEDAVRRESVVKGVSVKDICRCLLTAVVIPAVTAIPCAAYGRAYGTLLSLYQRAEISTLQFEAINIAIMLVVAASVFWVVSRAVAPKRWDSASIAVGLVVCILFALSMGHIFFVDMGLLYAMLIVIYAVGLIVSLKRRTAS